MMAGKAEPRRETGALKKALSDPVYPAEPKINDGQSTEVSVAGLI
jgi:hypothetical protein